MKPIQALLLSGDPCEGENLGVNPNRHEFRVREMLVETRIVCVMTNVF